MCKKVDLPSENIKFYDPFLKRDTASGLTVNAISGKKKENRGEYVGKCDIISKNDRNTGIALC